MTANRTQNAALDQQLILELRIDASGEVTRKPTKLGRKDTLEGKLLGQLYPGIRVARVSVPYELTPYEQSVVENRMASLNYGGVEYKLVGASGSAKDGKFYFVDQAHAGCGLHLLAPGEGVAVAGAVAQVHIHVELLLFGDD